MESFNTATNDSVEMLKNLFVKTEFKKGWILGNSPWHTTLVFYLYVWLKIQASKVV